jgi:hypothetical protein
LEEAIAAGSRASDEQSDLAIRVFELSQSLENQWGNADVEAKRQLLQIVCLNLSLDGATLCLSMRRPFDLLVEGPLVSVGQIGRAHV